jgi:hypothetical protein
MISKGQRSGPRNKGQFTTLAVRAKIAFWFERVEQAFRPAVSSIKFPASAAEVTLDHSSSREQQLNRPAGLYIHKRIAFSGIQAAPVQIAPVPSGTADSSPARPRGALAR